MNISSVDMIRMMDESRERAHKSGYEEGYKKAYAIAYELGIKNGYQIGIDDFQERLKEKCDSIIRDRGVIVLHLYHGRMHMYILKMI